MLNKEADIERIRYEKRAEDADKVFVLRLCVLCEVASEAEERAKL